MDPRIKKLAEILVEHSVAVQKGDHVKINLTDNGLPLLKAVYELCLRRGAHVRTEFHHTQLDYLFYKHAAAFQLKYFASPVIAEAGWADCIINICGPENLTCLKTISRARIKTRNLARKAILTTHKKKRVVVCNFPCASLAANAGITLKEYEDLYYGATNINWAEASRKQNRLKEILDRANSVRIRGRLTDLTLSIKGHLAIKGDGKVDMPDGEVYITPDKTSAEGTIYFDVPCIFKGNLVSGVYLEFKRGKVVQAKAEQNQRFLQTFLKSDKGAARLGELGIGTNEHITRFTRDILCDEKVSGTIHLALGNAYTKGETANTSSVHWDLIKDMTSAGSIELDGRCIQRNGRFC